MECMGQEAERPVDAVVSAVGRERHGVLAELTRRERRVVHALKRSQLHQLDAQLPDPCTP